MAIDRITFETIPHSVAAHERVMVLHDGLNNLVLATDQDPVEMQERLAFILNRQNLAIVSISDYFHRQEDFTDTMDCAGSIRLPSRFIGCDCGQE